MFIDKAKITIKGGDGGDGSVSFYRAKYLPNGGPDGGDGGKGGDVVFVADRNIVTLMDFRYKKRYAAENGEAGSKRNRFGKKGEDLIIRVPVGTVIREAASNKIMADMNIDGMEKVLINGGKGGKGNWHFATAVRQAPRYAEKGRKSREYEIILDLKLIADVGLIGLPNVGKSTLLSMVTNANPKIANYHFTTLSPNLGVVRNKYGGEFVLADIPGLIEGASLGAGLGHDFLGHVERTKVLIHVVDAAATEGGDPLDDIEKINAELESYSEALGKKPQIIAANKMDVPDAGENYEKIKAAWEPRGVKVFPVSAAGGIGLDELMLHVEQMIKDIPAETVYEEDFTEVSNAPREYAPFSISRPSEHYFVVEGVRVEKMIGYTNLEAEAGMAFFQKYMKENGIIAELEKQGIQDGDTVKIYNLEFEYFA